MACRSRPITDDVQLAATAGTDLALRLDHHLLVRQVIEIFVAASAALAGRGRLQRRIGLFFLRLRLGKRGLELIERERQLVIGDALGLAAEMRAADLGDDRLQPLVANGELVALGDDRAMRRTLLALRSIISASGRSGKSPEICLPRTLAPDWRTFQFYLKSK